MALAARFHVAPWEWRQRATPEDWATAVALIEREHEQVEEARRG